LVLNCDLILPSPSWVSYEPQAQILKKKVFWLPTSYKSNWHLEAKTLDKFCKKNKKNKKLLILNSPNNPSGTSNSELKNIAKNFNNKSFDIKKLKKMNDNDAINYITRLKGLGVWSAQMFLMFNLNRSDMYPTGDIGFLRALSLNYKTSYPPSKRFLDKISNLHLGYRTVLTWYMWRSIDPTDVEY